MILNTATITTVWQRHEVSKCCRKYGADVLAQYNFGQVYKCPICKKIKIKKHYLWGTIKTGIPVFFKKDLGAVVF